MKVSLSTYGGLTGGAGSRPVVVDLDDLDDGARKELSRLVSVASAASARGLPPAEPLPDAQVYEITIEDDEGQPVVLEAADGNIPPEFAELRKWLRDHGGTS